PYYNLNNKDGHFDQLRGVFPPTLNLASTSDITANATCGQEGPEEFCKMVEHVVMREPQCGVCDSRSPDDKKRHDITNAIDGTPNWWQSPTLQNGKKFEWVTITLDLKQVKIHFFKFSFLFFK
uniref:Laminin N-terminal domain-containing protein n=1 Tax=Strigamia maritima TaxID=126957 RepID=T1JP09_STRMM